MDAMASRPGNNPHPQLWQLPLLLLAAGLFGYAVWLVVPHVPRPTLEQKIEFACQYLKQDRPEAANEYLNELLKTEKLDLQSEGRIHLLLAETLDAYQRQKRLNLPTYHEQIVEQTQLALARGVKGDAAIYRRLGDSLAAAGHPLEALAAYRKALAAEGGSALSLHRKVIELQLAQGEKDEAQKSLEEYLKNRELTNAERAWAIGSKAQILLDRGEHAQARNLLEESLRLEVDPIACGQLNYYLGYCDWKVGSTADAERYFRVARDLLRVRDPLDADAAYALGRICQDRNDASQAISFYQAVLVSHIDSPVAPLARLGRGLCRILLGEDDAGLSDLHDLANQINQKSHQARYRAETVAGLEQAAQSLCSRGNYQGALEVMAYAQLLEPKPTRQFFARLGLVYERRAEQIEQMAASAKPAEQLRRVQQVREMRSHAGDAYIAYSRALTLVDDEAYGEALWKGVDLYDRAGDLQRVTGALELFVAERPDDPLAPEAMLRMGRAYQAAGMFDKAISAYQRNQFRYPQSLAASKSAVPLAQAYIAKGPEFFAKAESVLKGVVENNPLLTPEAEEFRQALLELGQLYYRTNRYEEAIIRMEEWIQRYPGEGRLGRLLFLTADSYRKSAGLLDPKLPIAGGDKSAAMDAAEVAAARKQRLMRAGDYFDRVVERWRESAPGGDIDKLYLKLAYFYRADCAYDLGDYSEAVRLYSLAAYRYQEDPSALAAYVQIVNAYCAMGKLDEARTANERAKWLLRRMPPGAFENNGLTLPKAYWQQWLKWTGEAGVL